MKPVQLTLHPSSALAGAFLLALCLVTLGAFSPQGPSDAKDIDAIEVVSSAPDEFIQITSSAPYTVPTGKKAVITALGGSDFPGPEGAVVRHQLLIGGDLIATTGLKWNYSANSTNTNPTSVSSMRQLPNPGPIAETGQSISVSVGSRAWGYLIDA